MSQTKLKKGLVGELLKAPNFLQSFRSSPTYLVPTHYMIDGVDVTSTFRLGPIHDAQARRTSAVSPSSGSDYISTTTPPESLAKTSGSAPRPSGRTSTAWVNSSTTTGSRSASTTRTPRTAHSV